MEPPHPILTILGQGKSVKDLCELWALLWINALLNVLSHFFILTALLGALPPLF